MQLQQSVPAANPAQPRRTFPGVAGSGIQQTCLWRNLLHRWQSHQRGCLQRRQLAEQRSVIALRTVHIIYQRGAPALRRSVVRSPVALHTKSCMQTAAACVAVHLVEDEGSSATNFGPMQCHAREMLQKEGAKSCLCFLRNIQELTKARGLCLPEHCILYATMQSKRKGYSSKQSYHCDLAWHPAQQHAVEPVKCDLA